MKKPSDPQETNKKLREKIIGLGETSIRKSYYPELQARLSELEAANERLQIEIEERKRAEQAVRESQDRFRELAEMLPETVFEMDLTGRLVFTNQHAFDQFGYTKKDFDQGVNAISLVVPFDRERAVANIERTVNGDDAGLSEYTLIRKDGTTFPGLIRSTTIVRAGQPWGIRGFIIDITRHKQTEAALLESEEKHRALVTQSPDGIFVVDLQGRFMSANQAICKGLGYSEDELLGLSVWELVPDKYREQYTERLSKLVSGKGSPDLAVYEVMDKNGEVHFIEVSSLPYHRDGRVIGYQGIARDITDRLKMEEEKKRLEQLLRQAQKMEAIGTLAGGVAHDFNNLLQAIGGYAQMLELNLTPDHPGRANLAAINNAVMRAAQLISQLLTFSRKVESKLRPLNLNREVTAIEQILRRTIPRMIDIRLDLAADVRTINADPVQIEQMLMNLVVNAKDAMPEGGVITIETRNVSLAPDHSHDHPEVPPGEYSVLAVSDTGQGMTTEVVEHIFEPFYTTKKIGRGTGLGLPMVYGIVQSHQGYITCSSDLGRGTVFRIYLPALARLPVPEQPPKRTVLPRGGRETILVVDDEDAVRDVTCKSLEKFGYQVLAAPDGERALELYAQARERIDLVILDLGMPGMGGYKCFQRLREINPAVKVVIASGYSFNVVVREIMDAGAAGFLGKPYQVADLLTKIRQVLDHDTEAELEG